MKIILRGRVPSKKNSKMVICRGKYPLVLPSKKYREWHKVASMQLIGCIPKKPIEKCEIEMRFFFPDNRRADQDNKAQSILDLFVDNGIIIDDKWQVVSDEHFIAEGIDRENPRVIIKINKVK